MSFLKSLFSLNTLVVIVLLLQLLFLYFLVNPISVSKQLNTVNLINKVQANKAANLPVELPTSQGIIGDGVALQTIDKIIAGNEVDKAIYKDAANGDYVVGYPSRLIIYRPSEDKIIYSGPTPGNKLQETQNAIINLVTKKALDAKLITVDNKTAPQVSIVTSPEEMKKVNADFYASVLKDDLIASFTNPNVVMIYRPSTDAIIKSGTIQVAIK